MAITLVEVYQFVSDILRQAQESESNARTLDQQVQKMEAEIARLQRQILELEAELDTYKVVP